MEAAFIVPLMLVFIASLSGFTYLAHQQNWSRGAAYESIYYGLQKSTEKTDEKERAAQRLAVRSEERPLDLSEFSYEVREGILTLDAEMSTTILPEVFGDLFSMEQSSKAAKIDPAGVKRAEWLAKYLLKSDQ